MLRSLVPSLRVRSNLAFDARLFYPWLVMMRSQTNRGRWGTTIQNQGFNQALIDAKQQFMIQRRFTRLPWVAFHRFPKIPLPEASFPWQRFWNPETLSCSIWSNYSGRTTRGGTNLIDTLTYHELTWQCSPVLLYPWSYPCHFIGMLVLWNGQAYPPWDVSRGIWKMILLMLSSVIAFAKV